MAPSRTPTSARPSVVALILALSTALLSADGRGQSTPLDDVTPRAMELVHGARRDALWAWARHDLLEPELLDAPPVDDLMAWSENEELEVFVRFDGVCTPLTIHRRADHWYAEWVESDLVDEAGARRRTYYPIHFGSRLLVLGPYWRVESPNADGGGAAGCFAEHGTLGHIGVDRVEWNGHRVGFAPACTEATFVAPCRDGGERECTRCVDVALHRVSRDPRYGYGYAPNRVQVRTDEPVDCSAPCPPDPGRRIVADLEQALRGRVLVALEHGPAVYRTREICEADVDGTDLPASCSY